MPLDFYKNSLKYKKDCNTKWRDMTQKTIDYLFDDTTIKRTIKEEVMPFNFQFEDRECWIDVTTDAITNMEKDTYDYKTLYFRDCSHTSTRGRYYQWENNYWIVYEDTTELDTISTCKIRRCNNILKWINEDGQLVQYPCVLDYTLQSPSTQVSKKITTSNGHVGVIIQGNKDTLAIPKNKRFLFNGTVYKFIAINNFMQSDYVDNNTPILFMEMYWDDIQDKDNLIENIADDTREEYSVEILEDNIEQVKDFTTKLEAKAYYSNKELDVELVWKSSDEDIVTVDEDGNIEIKGEVGQEANIEVCIKNNDKASDSITVKIVEALDSNRVLLIAPQINYLTLYESKTISANLIIDNIIQDDVEIECIASGVDDKYYTLIDNQDNTWTLTNNVPTNKILHLEFKCEELTESLDIKLKALF